MKKFILIILILGVLVMLKPINSIIKDSIGNILFRGNVVTGIVATDNGDGSYDCYISQSEQAYPKIFTLSANPDLAVGDKVRILYKGGCKELPIILPPSTAAVTATGEIFVTFETGSPEVSTIKSFTTEGVEVSNWQTEDYQLMYNGMCVDSSGNVYYVAFSSPHKIIKYDSLGNEVIKLSASYQIKNIAISSDGFIYTHEFTDSDNNMIMKRSSSTLQILSSFQLDPWTNSFYGMAFYDDDRFYIVNSSSDKIEMWKVSTGSKIAEVAVDSGKTSNTSLTVAGDTVLGIDFAYDPWYVPTNLGASETDWSIGITSCVSAASKDGSFYVFGSKTYGGALFLGKYDESGVEIWEVEAVEAGYYPSSVGAYPF